jgi:acyl-CoA thioesterase I
MKFSLLSKGSTSAGRIALPLRLILTAGLVTNSALLQADDTASAKAPRKSVVVLGDSLAAGYGLDQTEAFPALLQTKIDDAGFNFVVVNAGVSGDTTAGGLRRLDWLLRRKIDVLVIELGGNDGLRGISVDVTRANLQAIIDRTREKYRDVKIIVAGMQMPPNMGDDYTREFQTVFSEIAKKNNAALIPFLLEGVGGQSKLNQADQIHPTPEGHKIVAENVWKVLRPVLQAAASEK